MLRSAEYSSRSRRRTADEPERQASRGEVVRLIQATLDALPNRYGDVLEWKYVDGLSVKQIAQRLGVGPKAAESLLTRARGAFRETLQAIDASTDLLNAAADGGAGMTESSDYDPVAPGMPEPDALAELIRAAAGGPRRAPRTTSACSRRAARRGRRRCARSAAATGTRSRRGRARGRGTLSLLSQGPAPMRREPRSCRGKWSIRARHGAEWTPVPAGAAIAEGARVRTVGEGRAAFELAGGASLRASTATEWSFEGPRRIELAAGTLYVDSGTAAAGRGVEIVTAFGVVRDVGTQFEVRALSTGLRIRVREGLAEPCRSVVPAACPRWPASSCR